MTEDCSWMLVHRPATIVFRTVHWDRAGETSSHHVVRTVIADVDPAGTALLVTRTGVTVHFPMRMLYPVDPAEPVPRAYVGGQELTRDFHPTGDAPRTVLRYMDRPEVEAALPPRPRARRRPAPKRRKAK